MISDEIQILENAYMIFRGITILEFLKVNAWIIRAFVTEFHFALVKKSAMLFKECTGLVLGSATWTFIFSLLTSHSISIISNTGSAVVSTRCDKLRSH